MENVFEEKVVTAENPETEEYTAAPAAPATPVAQAVDVLKKIPKVIWIAAAAVVVVIIAAILVIGAVTNTYETPLKLQYNLLNTRECDNPLEESLKLLNGFSEDALLDIISIYEKTDAYEDLEDGLKDSFEASVEYYEDTYGEDYKFSYEIEDKDELDSDDLKEMKTRIKNLAKNLKNALDETEDYDSDDWEDMADEIGISKSDAKKLVKAMEALYKEWKSVDVTEGYELEVVKIIEGEELDEPEEQTMTVYVYKVNGRWISSEIFYTLGSLPII